ncbi:MAG TPA: RagB/SusD family nutrient uptake outer membrane protein [Puia sp.]|nr:RagB/SusD family nutrient uptake outer membrane protein [Puia sp.]
MSAISSLHRYTLAALTGVALTGLSCKKLIQVPANPPNMIPTAQVFVDSSDIMAAMAGVYGNFKVNGGGVCITNGLVTIDAGLSADELAYNLASDANTLQFMTNGLTSANTLADQLWSSAYSALYQVNACLQGIQPSKGISDPLKQQLIGELKVIRAFYYFHLVNLFGGVPLVTQTNFNITQSQPRATVDSVYGLILADLTAARTMLKAAYPSAGRARINLYTADAFLAKVFLYRGDWLDAANTAGEAINSNQYSLVTDLTKVYLDGSTEAIWQLPGKGTSTQTTEAATLIPFSNFSVPNYTIAATLLSAFETGDARRQNWLASSTIGGKTYYYAYKYRNRLATAATTEDYMMFRLGELYLNRAEALANQGKTDSALADLNKIRVRAALPAITTVASQAALLTVIAHERQVELFCEWGARWFDLKRTGTIDSVLGAEKPGWQSFDALYPIPQTEITDNSFLTQNQGY